MLLTTITVIHVLLAAGLIGLVLFQRGKGAEAGAAFGAGASGTVFGARGSASFLTRTTGVLATLLFVTSLSLAYLSGQREGPVSVLVTGRGREVEPSRPAVRGTVRSQRRATSSTDEARAISRSTTMGA